MDEEHARGEERSLSRCVPKEKEEGPSWTEYEPNSRVGQRRWGTYRAKLPAYRVDSRLARRSRLKN